MWVPSEVERRVLRQQEGCADKLEQLLGTTWLDTLFPVLYSIHGMTCPTASGGVSHRNRWQDSGTLSVCKAAWFASCAWTHTCSDGSRQRRTEKGRPHAATRLLWPKSVNELGFPRCMGCVVRHTKQKLVLPDRTACWQKPPAQHSPLSMTVCHRDAVLS